MDNLDKFYLALQVLKSGVECVWSGDINSQNDFNNIQWVTGESGGTAITTTTCPHSEITWTLLKAEMDKL
jgi:hypothetical protein